MNDDSIKGAVYMDMAKSYWQNGELDRALELSHDALLAFKEADDHHNLAACLQNIGLIQFSQGDVQPAMETLELALRIAQRYRYEDIAQALNKNLDAMLQSLGAESPPPKKTLLGKLFKK